MVTLLRSVELPDRKVDATCDLYIGGDRATEREFHHIPTMAASSVALDTPIAGNYFVSVQASAANRELTVGCGNLAAPTT